MKKYKIGKAKLSFYLSSGQIFVIKCKGYELTKLSGSKGHRELNINGSDRKWSIDLDQVIAFSQKWVLF